MSEVEALALRLGWSVKKKTAAKSGHAKRLMEAEMEMEIESSRPKNADEDGPIMVGSKRKLTAVETAIIQSKQLSSQWQQRKDVTEKVLIKFPKELINLIVDLSEPACIYWPSVGKMNHIKVWRWCVEDFNHADERFKPSMVSAVSLLSVPTAKQIRQVCRAYAKKPETSLTPINCDGSFILLLHLSHHSILYHFNSKTHKLTSLRTVVADGPWANLHGQITAVFPSKDQDTIGRSPMQDVVLYFSGTGQGRRRSDHPTSPVWSLDVTMDRRNGTCSIDTKNEWKSVADLPIDLSDHCAVGVHGCLVVLGGYRYNPTLPVLGNGWANHDAYMYVPTVDKWYPLPKLPEVIISSVATAVDGGTIIVYPTAPANHPGSNYWAFARDYPPPPWTPLKSLNLLRLTITPTQIQNMISDAKESVVGLTHLQWESIPVLQPMKEGLSLDKWVNKHSSDIYHSRWTGLETWQNHNQFASCHWLSSSSFVITNLSPVSDQNYTQVNDHPTTKPKTILRFDLPNSFSRL